MLGPARRHTRTRLNQPNHPTRRRRDSPSQIVLALEIKESAFRRGGPNVGTFGHRQAAKYKIVSPNTGFRVRAWTLRAVSWRPPALERRR